MSDEQNRILLNNYSVIIQKNQQERTAKDDIICSSLPVWIVQNVFKLVSTDKPDEAMNDLKLLGQADIHQQELCNLLTTAIIDGNLNNDKSNKFWLDKYIRLLSYAESITLLSQFREQFQEYTQIISDSERLSKDWYDAHWNKVKIAMKQILEFALQQLIVAASNANTREEKLAYLSHIDLKYNFNEDWYNLLNDELKFLAAHIYHSLGEKDKFNLFWEHILDLPTLIKSKNNAEFTEQALMLLEEMDPFQHRQILLQSQVADRFITDQILFNHVVKLIETGKLNEASCFLQEVNSFNGKHTLNAYIRELVDHPVVMHKDSSKQLLSRVTLFGTKTINSSNNRDTICSEIQTERFFSRR